MQKLHLLVLVCSLTLVLPAMGEEKDRMPDRTAFIALLAKPELPLPKQSGCEFYMNPQGDRTVGQLVAGFLSMPAAEQKHTHFIHSSCRPDKRETPVGLIDTRQCTFTVTEEALTANGEKVHVIGTLVFSITTKGNMLIPESMLCL
ncbi:MAG: hypothetical protein OEZ39_14270 [Gammaproteobacteria bacterium]|nr:hypothetical protein [Gammaproteobacteria bacterium]MDH5653018.1 hypothetical protein [Gammaproteobacteria bacterium]